MKILKVKHIKQTMPTSCGATCLAMTYKFFRKSGQTETVVWNRIKTPRPSNPSEFYTDTQKIVEDAKSLGFSYFVGHAVINSSNKLALQPIKEFLSLGVPVIINQQISETNNLGHYRIVLGITKNEIILNDPLENQGKIHFTKAKFMSLWQRNTNGEVPGGVFIAIFKKRKIPKSSCFTINSFNSSIQYFNATNLKLNI